MRYLQLAVVTFVAVALTVAASEVRGLRVRIFESGGGPPIPGVVVELTHDSKTASEITDSNGMATFEGLQSGLNYNLVVIMDKGRGRTEFLNIDPRTEDISIGISKPSVATETPDRDAPEDSPEIRGVSKLPRQLTAANATDYLAYVASKGLYKEDQVVHASLFLQARTGIPSQAIVPAPNGWLVFRERLKEDVKRWRDAGMRDAADTTVKDAYQHLKLFSGDVSSASYAVKYIECMDERHEMIICHSGRYLARG